MLIRLLLATTNPEFVQLMQGVLDSALQLVCLDVVLAVTSDRSTLLDRVGRGVDDVVLLDWEIDQGETPHLVSEILKTNPKMRVVAMLPLSHRQYRQLVWDAGACNGIPKEHVDQEWMATVLCIMQRAMEREHRLLQTVYEQGNQEALSE